MAGVWRGTDAEIRELLAEERFRLAAEAVASTPYEMLPVIPRLPGELADLVGGGDGYFRMGAQVGWSPDREGLDEPPKLSGRLRVPRHHQDVHTCDVCGGLTRLCRLDTREELEVPRAAVEPGWVMLRPGDTCAGCLRQGEAAAAKTELAELAAIAAAKQDRTVWEELNQEARRAGGIAKREAEIRAAERALSRRGCRD